MTFRNLATIMFAVFLIGCDPNRVKQFDDCNSARFEKYCSLTESGTYYVAKELARAGIKGYTRIEIKDLCEKEYAFYGYDYRDSIDSRIEQFCGSTEDDVQ